jgi:hypothetical protein
LVTAALGIAAVTEIPDWACFGIVGASTAIVGGCLVFFAKKEASDVKVLPPPETAGALKENYQWITGKQKS